MLLIGVGGDDKLAEWVSGVIGQRGPSHDPSCDLTKNIAFIPHFDSCPKYRCYLEYLLSGYCFIVGKFHLFLFTGHEPRVVIAPQCQVLARQEQCRYFRAKALVI